MLPTSSNRRRRTACSKSHRRRPNLTNCCQTKRRPPNPRRRPKDDHANCPCPSRRARSTRPTLPRRPSPQLGDRWRRARRRRHPHRRRHSGLRNSWRRLPVLWLPHQPAKTAAQLARETEALPTSTPPCSVAPARSGGAASADAGPALAARWAVPPRSSGRCRPRHPSAATMEQPGATSARWASGTQGMESRRRHALRLRRPSTPQAPPIPSCTPVLCCLSCVLPPALPARPIWRSGPFEPTFPSRPRPTQPGPPHRWHRCRAMRKGPRRRLPPGSRPADGPGAHRLCHSSSPCPLQLSAPAPRRRIP
mmetsp:Transcript_63720/g.184809  ORF Transcript_63720/g.184809 Transcript_63720/m.184809 type:complete len:308 (-) Transcript_63720:469-1392(-)